MPPRRPSLGIPFWLVWPFSVPHTRLHLMPRLAASGPISRLGPLSLLHWVFLLRPVRLSARSMGSGGRRTCFPVCGRSRPLPSFPVRLLFLVLLPRSPCVPWAVGRVSRLRSSISRSPLFRTPSLFLFACSRIACNCSLIF